ncbi:MAG TPA: type II toxin-antitoxin system RelE/ParE family toxin [bacterium]|nr:type II toxin-antitoxin system RelE/ParE family toxin [bacterium]
MKIRWLAEAVGDLTAIRAYIARDNPAAAAEVARRIRDAVGMLADYPGAGRPGRVPETRELVIGGTPYLLPYRVQGDAVEILRVLHSAQQWPDR